MANSIFNQLNGGVPQGSDLLTRFQQFKNSFNGNPQQMIQQMLNSGRISQAQYNAAVQKAQMLGKMLGLK